MNPLINAEIGMLYTTDSRFLAKIKYTCNPDSYTFIFSSPQEKRSASSQEKGISRPSLHCQEAKEADIFRTSSQSTDSAERIWAVRP